MGKKIDFLRTLTGLDFNQARQAIQKYADKIEPEIKREAAKLGISEADLKRQLIESLSRTAEQKITREAKFTEFRKLSSFEVAVPEELQDQLNQTLAEYLQTTDSPTSKGLLEHLDGKTVQATFPLDNKGFAVEAWHFLTKDRDQPLIVRIHFEKAPKAIEKKSNQTTNQSTTISVLNTYKEESKFSVDSRFFPDEARTEDQTAYNFSPTKIVNRLLRLNGNDESKVNLLLMDKDDKLKRDAERQSIALDYLLKLEKRHPLGTIFPRLQRFTSAQLEPVLGFTSFAEDFKKMRANGDMEKLITFTTESTSKILTLSDGTKLLC